MSEVKMVSSAAASVEWHKLGEFIEECTERNESGTYTVGDLRGVNNQQQFCESRANTAGIDFRPYKVVHKDCFAYNPARLDIGSIAKFDGEACIVSTLYEVFRIQDNKRNELMPEYLQMYFAREEFARYVGFKNWGSAREYFWIDAMKRVPIPVPPIAEQRKTVEAWQGLRKMKEDNEQLAEPLLALCRSYLQECKRKYPMVEIGSLIEEVNIRNDDELFSSDDVRGISTGKELIQTAANLEGVNLATYKIVAPEQFAYVSDTSRRGDKISLGYNQEEDPFLVSSISTVFSVDPKQANSTFLYLWFCRPEFDRYARFNSWGSARETFDWADMCRVKIPLPPLDVQKAIVDVYRCANEAKKIAAEADRLSREICPALIQHVIKEVA